MNLFLGAGLVSVAMIALGIATARSMPDGKSHSAT